MLSNHPEYSPEKCSYPSHASSYPDQYLGETQSSNSSYNSDESQYKESSNAASRDEQWFSDFILYDSDESTTGAEAMSVVKTSGLVTVGPNNGTLALPLSELLPESVPESIDGVVTDDTALSRWLNLTEFDIESPAVGLGSTENNSQWTTDPVLDFFVSNHPESPLGADSTVSLPSDASPAQDDAPNKVAVPRMRHHICPTCKFYCVSQCRLREHLQQYHSPPRFICSTCCRGFQAKRDLLRHIPTHETSKPTFTCSCNKSYKRLDSLQRHIAALIAQKPTETGVHKPV